jgi:23S rRNA (uracil1939-C5)-methyltransferase
MANGGAALGRDTNDRVVFVPFAIPGERVLVEIAEDKKRFAKARLLEVLDPAQERVEPRCPHFGLCGGCHFQHINYKAQLQYKEAVVRDQLARIGGLDRIVVRPTLATSEPWSYATDISFSATTDGELGLWSPVLGRVIPIETCHIIHERLLELIQDIDLVLPDLRRLTLRLGDDGSPMAALEVEDVEAPSLETDFPISVTLILPDGTAANLVGKNTIVRSVKGRDFRISAGSFFYSNPQATENLVKVVIDYIGLIGDETILELYNGVGTLTAFLAQNGATVVGIEVNPDAVADAAINLYNLEQVTLYEGLVEEILPLLDIQPGVLVVDPPMSGLPPTVIDDISVKQPNRVVYISSDVATLARDGKRLATKGYQLVEVQPIDMYPQSFLTLTVSLWALS